MNSLNLDSIELKDDTYAPPHDMDPDFNFYNQTNNVVSNYNYYLVDTFNETINSKYLTDAMPIIFPFSFICFINILKHPPGQLKWQPHLSITYLQTVFHKLDSSLHEILVTDILIISL